MRDDPIISRAWIKGALVVLLGGALGVGACDIDRVTASSTASTASSAAVFVAAVYVLSSISFSIRA
jgi:hypothetical protein